MNLLSPMLGAALLAATLVPLVALYFLRLRRTRRVVSSTLPWVRRTDDLRANAPFQRLRATPLLLLQIALLALLALAAAQPVLRGLGSRGGRVILLVDCSASMQTLDGDGGVSRLEQARRAAIARAESLQGGGLFALAAPEIMVISFAAGAEVRTPFTGSLPRVREAIERITPTDERTRLGPALELARAHRAGTVSESDGAPRGEATIELFSDGRIGDADEVALRGSERLAWTRVGSETTPNAGLAAVGLERSVDDPGQVAAFAGLRNFAGLDVARSVEVLADGSPIATTPAPVEVPARRMVNGVGVAGERRLVFPPFSSPTERLIEVRTQPLDAFPVDDRAFVSLRAAKALSLALVGADESLAALLAALGPKALARLDRGAAEAAIAKDPRWAEGFDAVISVGKPVSDLSRGRWLHFGAPPALPGLNPFGEPGRDYATAVRGDHPVMRACNVNELVAQRVNRVAAESVWTPLVEGSRGPLALAGRTANGYALLVLFEPGDSNWPFQRSFVNFTAQAIEMLANLTELAGDEAVEPGDMIRVRLPEGATAAQVTPPGGTAEPMSVRDGEASWGPARRAGAYRVSWAGAGGVAASRWLVVNALDAAECDVAAATGLSLAGTTVAPTGGGLASLDLWPWLIGLALALLLVEWWLWHRAATR